MRKRKSFLASLMLSLFLATAASAESLKIGVLNDQSGVQADFAGTGSVIAARMAVEDFGVSLLVAQVMETRGGDDSTLPTLPITETGMLKTMTAFSPTKFLHRLRDARTLRTGAEISDAFDSPEQRTPCHV